MRNLILAGLACAALVATPALSIRPRQIASADRMQTGMGAVRLSIQSQVQLTGGSLFVWFLKEGGDPERRDDLLRLERGQGVPILGRNMVDSRPRIFALPPGRYRLIAHSAGCSTLPPPNAICSNGSPTQRYAGDTPIFEVRPGHLTDAGEFILEAPPGTPIGEGTGVREGIRNPSTFSIRVRETHEPVPDAFASLPRGPATIVPAEFRSSIRCRLRPEGAMMYLPFEC